MSEPGAKIIELPGHRRRAALSLAPLIDVTFILLIFFMLVSQFGHIAPGGLVLNSEAIVNERALSAEADQMPQRRLTLGADGMLRLSSGPTFTIDDLPGVLDREAQKAERAGDERRIIAVAAAPDASLGTLIDLVRQIGQRPPLAAQIVVPGEETETQQ